MFERANYANYGDSALIVLLRDEIKCTVTVISVTVISDEIKCTATVILSP